MFCTRVAWVCLVCLLLCREEGSSPVSAITERRDMGLYEVPLFVSFFVKSRFKHTREECDYKRAYVF